jgi:hypothetical protein
VFKNISTKGIAVLLACSFTVTSFSAGVKSANAAAAPAIFALSLIVGSIAGYAGSNKPGGYYAYRNKPYPAPVKSGPHFIQRLDAHFLVDMQNQIWLGDNNSGTWLLQESWERKNGKTVTKEDLHARSYP